MTTSRWPVLQKMKNANFLPPTQDTPILLHLKPSPGHLESILKVSMLSSQPFLSYKRTNKQTNIHTYIQTYKQNYTYIPGKSEKSSPLSINGLSFFKR